MSDQVKDINFRRATVEDVELLVHSRLQFLNSFFNHPYDKETESLDSNLRIYFSKKLNTGEYISWLAERKGSLVGVGGLVIWDLPPKYTIINGRAGYILNIYTLPEFRSNGICTTLLKKLISEAKEAGVSYLHLHASKQGWNVYKKMGFVAGNQNELCLRLQA